jgi:superfamily I DNA/RNA helicase
MPAKARDERSFKPTDEQEAVLAAYQNSDGVCEAYAGAGKTATLKLLAQDSPRDKFQYVAYNRAIADDAKRSFPRNTTCQTMHSIAFRAVGFKFKDRLGGARMRGKEIANFLGIKHGFLIREGNFLRDWQLAMKTMETVRNWCYSADREIGPQHVAWIPGAEATFDELSQMLAGFARKAWQDIMRENGVLKFEHDHYLKMWALTNPQIYADYILLDEAQDANPVIAGVVLAQDAQKILVGDRNQQIYAWRGAVDAMQNFDADWRLLLSQSFRFGEAVANEGNKWLRLLGNTVPLKGWHEIESEVCELSDPKTILCRTNATVIAEAIAKQEEGKRISIVGGTDEILRFAKAVQILQDNAGVPEQARQPVTHPDLMAFGTWQDVKEYVEEEGTDLKMLVDMIDRYGVRGIMDVANRAVDETYADTILSTAHKAKGREWESVRIAGDFKEPVDEETGERKVNKPEFQLLYVAVTRAKRQLDCSAVGWVDSWIDELDGNEPEPEQDGKAPVENGRTLLKAKRKIKERQS